MATLTTEELQELRHSMARQFPVTWTKTQVNAALQAIEDRMRLASTQNAIATDIEATAPGVFTAGQKARLFGVWCVTAAQRLGVL